MTRRDPTPADAVLVAIDIAKARNEVLIAPPGARRRRLTVLNTRAEHDRLAEILSGYAAPVVVGFEATGDYYRTRAWRLADAGVQMRLISSVALARTREAPASPPSTAGVRPVGRSPSTCPGSAW